MCVRRWVYLALLTACDGGGGRLRMKDMERLSQVWVAKRFLELWQRHWPHERRNTSYSAYSTCYWSKKFIFSDVRSNAY